MQEEQNIRLAEMISWLASHPDQADLLYAPVEPSVPALLDAADALATQGYYEYLLILLLRHSESEPVYQGLLSYLSDCAGRAVIQNGAGKEARVLLEHLKDALAQSSALRP